MIVASLVLIAGAIALLVLGLLEGSSGLLVGSIGTSLLAAVALIVGVRQASGEPADAFLAEDTEPGEAWDHELSGQPARVPLTATEQGATASSHVPMQASHDDSADAAVADINDGYEDEDPPDEPVPQRVSAGDAARVARMATEVLVIDGRPRYHVAGCVHLLGRPCEGLAVSEAVELGFSPCGLCEPDSALLADARRV